MPPEASLRECMASHARTLAKSNGRRPSFAEAKRYADLCGSKEVAPREVDTLACAFSQQWSKCGSFPPTD